MLKNIESSPCFLAAAISNLLLAPGFSAELQAASITFQAKVDYATGANPGSLSVADVNNDGRFDVLTSNLSDSTLSVLINTTP